jgi:hypothetical protein
MTKQLACKVNMQEVLMEVGVGDWVHYPGQTYQGPQFWDEERVIGKVNSVVQNLDKENEVRMEYMKYLNQRLEEAWDLRKL